MLKDPYNFDFLMLAEDAKEREIESGLIAHLQKFLVELGIGFASVGRPYPLDVGGKDYRLDLLFYHLKLRCFVVIEIKGGEFKPEYAGKLNFYLAAVDDALKHPSDQPSIGLILCKSKTAVIVEYALRGTTTPMGIGSSRICSSCRMSSRGRYRRLRSWKRNWGRAESLRAESRQGDRPSRV